MYTYDSPEHTMHFYPQHRATVLSTAAERVNGMPRRQTYLCGTDADKLAVVIDLQLLFRAAGLRV